MTKKKKIWLSIAILSLIAIIAICILVNLGDNRYDASAIERLSYESPNVKYNGIENYTSVVFDDVNKLRDSIDSHELIGCEYARINSQSSDQCLNLKFNTHNGIPIKARKTICFYPTLWAEGNDGYDLIQFIYLFDLGYRYTRELIVSDGAIKYPSNYLQGYRSIDIDQEGKDFFNKISLHQIKESIRKVPTEYKKKKKLGYSYASWSREESGWLKITKDYKRGCLLDPNNKDHIFGIHPLEVFLEITFKDNQGREVTKVFTDKEIIGN